MKKQDLIKIWLGLNINIKDIESIIKNESQLSTSQFFLFDLIEERVFKTCKKKFLEISLKKPIEYVLNKANFYGLDFYVDENVLIPRNETELLVDEVLQDIKLLKKQKISLIDVWTWSWCILISILNSYPMIKNQCFATDISEKALDIANINLKKYSLQNKLRLINSNLLDIFLSDTSFLCSRWDLTIENLFITANLPYIKNKDFKNINESVLKYEPNIALYWWKKTGFELYEKLIYDCLELNYVYNIWNLVLFIEIGFDQFEISKNFLKWLKTEVWIF